MSGHHRVKLTWRGETVETLDDLIPSGCRVLSIGINPSPVSVAAGHYYQGRLGKRFYARMREAGAYVARDGWFEDDLLFERGFGFTDIVKKPTRAASELTSADYAHGLTSLRQKIERTRPRLVLFTYKKTAEVVLGRVAGELLLDMTLCGARVFLMPSPYAAKAVEQRGLAALRECLGKPGQDGPAI